MAPIRDVEMMPFVIATLYFKMSIYCRVFRVIRFSGPPRTRIIRRYVLSSKGRLQGVAVGRGVLPVLFTFIFKLFPVSTDAISTRTLHQIRGLARDRVRGPRSAGRKALTGGGCADRPPCP